MAKAARVAPRPVDSLRPVVRCQTVRYNMRVRAGRGFTLEELRGAGVSPKLAPTVGIAVDHRRTNKSAESLTENVARIKAYMAKLVIAPRKGGKATAAARADFAKLAQTTAAAPPIRQPEAKVTFVEVTEAMTGDKHSAFKTLRQERTNAKLQGRRAKRAADAAKEAAPAAAPAPAE